jgi:predicted nucleic acid-binding protein
VNAYVVDASVAVKLYLRSDDEELQTKATRLFDQYVEGVIDLLVPDLFWVEVANVLWKNVQRRRISADTAHTALAAIRMSNPKTFPSDALVEDPLGIAITFGIPVYDALYVALAQRASAPLVTADQRLANAMGAHFPVLG